MSSKRFALPVAVAGVLLAALPAAAHVTVHGNGASSGADDAEVVFRVPNEENVPTVKLEVALPADHPIAGVSVENKPGWRFAVHTRKLATPITTDDGQITTVVDTVTWTATAGGIPADGYEDFTLAAGHLPETSSLTFKAVQTYQGGEVVRWIETGSDSEHPAPVLDLAPASADPTASPQPSPIVAVTATTDDGSSDALAGTGLGVAVLAVLLALGAFVRSGRARKD